MKIVDRLKDSLDYEFNLTYSEHKQLLDYITNLQEEMDRLINLNKQLVEECQRLDDEEIRLNNIINELEKELREGSFDVYFCSTNTQKTFKSNEIIIKSLILNKLKELKEENNE